MDYIIGFIFGIFFKKFTVWLDEVAQPKIPDNFNEEDWDWGR